MPYQNELQTAYALLTDLPTHWDGKASVLELKNANYNWRQMEWWGFYFEWLCQQRLHKHFSIPGDKYGKAKSACFDLKSAINWDIKAKAIKSDEHRSILNDTAAMDASIQQYGFHGLIIGLCDVEYNDKDRSFQQWHAALKGKKSKYEQEREERTSISRYRKTQVDLQQVLFLVLHPQNLNFLEIHHQGRNSNGKPRPPKYMLNYADVDKFLVSTLSFPSENIR